MCAIIDDLIADLLMESIKVYFNKIVDLYYKYLLFNIAIYTYIYIYIYIYIYTYIYIYIYIYICICIYMYIYMDIYIYVTQQMWYLFVYKYFTIANGLISFYHIVRNIYMLN